MPATPRTLLADSREESRIERLKINFSWVLKLRWAAVGGQLLTIAIISRVMGIWLPVGMLLTIIGIEAFSNLALSTWFEKRGRSWGAGWLQAGERLIFAVMLVDIAILSALLYVSGGAANPCIIFYLAHIALAAVVLPTKLVWVLTVISMICYAVLHSTHLTLPDLEPFEADHDSAGARALPLHFQGLGAAFGALAVIIVYFVTRVTSVLSKRERELAEARQRRAESERLEALATLAGGAAHELASPLSTIAVIAKELEHELARQVGHSAGDELGEAVEDTRLIRKEVARCRSILDQMSADAGESVGEEVVHVTVERLLEETLSALSEERRQRVRLSGGEMTRQLFIPKLALAQTIRALIKNGQDASPPGAEVEVVVDDGIRESTEEVRIRVRDRGEGMKEEVLARCFDPFYTTKQSGAGMGLGLFLARAVVERLGGRLSMESRVGQGTTATVVLPAVQRTGSKAAPRPPPT